MGAGVSSGLGRVRCVATFVHNSMIFVVKLILEHGNGRDVVVGTWNWLGVRVCRRGASTVSPSLSSSQRLSSSSVCTVSSGSASFPLTYSPQTVPFGVERTCFPPDSISYMAPLSLLCLELRARLNHSCRTKAIRRVRFWLWLIPSRSFCVLPSLFSSATLSTYGSLFQLRRRG